MGKIIRQCSKSKKLHVEIKAATNDFLRTVAFDMVCDTYMSTKSIYSDKLMVALSTEDNCLLTCWWHSLHARFGLDLTKHITNVVDPPFGMLFYHNAIYLLPSQLASVKLDVAARVALATVGMYDALDGSTCECCGTAINNENAFPAPPNSFTFQSIIGYHVLHVPLEIRPVGFRILPCGHMHHVNCLFKTYQASQEMYGIDPWCVNEMSCNWTCPQCADCEL